MAKKSKKSEPKKTEPVKLRCEHDPGESGTYDWVKAIVDFDDDGGDGGSVYLSYHVTGLDRDGSDSFCEDNLKEWSDCDIQNVAGSMLGIIEEDCHLIKVEM